MRGWDARKRAASTSAGSSQERELARPLALPLDAWNCLSRREVQEATALRHRPSASPRDAGQRDPERSKGNPRMRVLQDLTQATFRTLGRLWPDSE